MTVSADPLVLTMAETARLLRVSLRTVKAMVASGQLSSVKLGRRRLVAYEGVVRLVSTGGQDGAPALTADRSPP